MTPALNLSSRDANPQTLTRRSIIVLGGAGAAAAAAVALVGCSSGAASPNVVTGGKPTEIAKLADIPVGGSIIVSLDGQQVVLSQPEAGTVKAFSAVCPHQGCIVAPDAKKELNCPCHGSRFNAATGAVLAGPAMTALTSIAVTVNGSSVVSA